MRLKFFNFLCSTLLVLVLGSSITFFPANVSAASTEAEYVAMLNRNYLQLVNNEYLKMLKKKLDKVEKNQAELYHSLGEKKRAGLKGQITDKINFGGIIEVEASFDSNDKLGDTSDIVLATALLGFGAEINKHVSGNIVLLFEEDSTPLSVDEGLITITLTSNYSLKAGLFYLPIGAYHSHFISDPITLELGETTESALMVTYSGQGSAFEFSFGLFNGAREKTGDANKIDDYFASVKITPAEGLMVGAYYISDFAETSNMETLVPARTKTVAGQGAYISYEFKKYAFEAEYITAANSYNAADLDANSDGSGDKPCAYNLELSYNYNAGTQIALRLEGSSDFFDWPERQYGVAVAYGIYENVAIAFELLHGEYDSSSVQRTLATTRLAIEF